MKNISLLMLFIAYSINGMEQNVDAKIDPMPLSKMDKLASFAKAFATRQITFNGKTVQFCYFNNCYLKEPQHFFNQNR